MLRRFDPRHAAHPMVEQALFPATSIPLIALEPSAVRMLRDSKEDLDRIAKVWNRRWGRVPEENGKSIGPIIVARFERTV
jgi:hypothetical protein